MRDKIREDEIKHNTQVKAIADFLQKVLQHQQQSKKVSFKSESDDSENPIAQSPEDVYESLPSTSSFETPKKVKFKVMMTMTPQKCLQNTYAIR
jgi:hypothetical protein